MTLFPTSDFRPFLCESKHLFDILKSKIFRVNRLHSLFTSPPSSFNFVNPLKIPLEPGPFRPEWIVSPDPSPSQSLSSCRLFSLNHLGVQYYVVSSVFSTPSYDWPSFTDTLTFHSIRLLDFTIRGTLRLNFYIHVLMCTLWLSTCNFRNRDTSL